VECTGAMTVMQAANLCQRAPYIRGILTSGKEVKTYPEGHDLRFACIAAPLRDEDSPLDWFTRL